MTFQLTIMGLGQIGCSVGMALKDYKDDILRVGHDKSREAVVFAKENDAVDKVALTMSGAVSEADIILLALPLQEIYPVMEHIAQDIKDDVLVMDTSPLKAPVVKWMEDLLPEGASYVGLTPVLKAEYLADFKHGSQSAHPDLFHDSLMGVVTSPKATEKAINMAANFVELLDAAPYFTDPVEMDGLMSMTHLMPQLLASVMLDMCQTAPGWREARKFAGKHFSQMTNSFGEDEVSGSLAAWLEHNPDNTLRLIDELIRALEDLRGRAAAPQGEELAGAFERLQQGRERWLDEREDSPWVHVQKMELPERRGIFAQLMGFRKPKRQDQEG